MILDEDADHIRSLVARLPENAMVADLGAGYGDTARCVLEVHPTVSVLSFDIDTNVGIHIRSLQISGGFPNRWSYISLSSFVAATLFQPENFDMVMIDTTHLYEDTQGELRLWIPLLKRNSPLWLHDYADYPGTNYPGVKDAITEHLDEFSDIQLMGLGWSGIRK